MRLLYIVVLVATLKYAEAKCYNGSIETCVSCGGSCETFACYCIDGTTSCIPTDGECISGTNECCPPGYFYDTSISCCTDTPACNLCAGNEICNNGTCSCNATLYKGKTINDLKPSLQCEKDVMIVSIDRCLLTYLKYDYTTFQLRDNSTECIPVTYPTTVNNAKIDNFQAELTQGWCGNTITNDSEKIYITNTLHIDTLKSPLITVNPLRFNFTCTYNMTMQISLNYSLRPIVGTTYLSGINGTGLFALTMAAFWDSKYAKPIAQDDTVTVGETFFLGLFVNYADGSAFSLRVDSCVASPINSSSASATVNLVTGGCAVGEDVSTVVEENGQSLEARIRVNAFKFESTDSVYIFCNVRLCDKSTDCSKCDRGRSSSRTSEVMIQLPYNNFDFTSGSVTHSALPWAVLCSTVLGFLSIKLY